MSGTTLFSRLIRVSTASSKTLRFAQRTYLTSKSAAFEPFHATLPPNQDPRIVMIGMSSAGLGLLIDNLQQGLYKPVATPIVITGDPKMPDSNWLNRIHESYFGHPWGQPFSAMPPVLKQYLLQLDPNLVRGGKLTFRHMRDLRFMLIEAANKHGIKVIEESVDSISETGIIRTNQGKIIKSDCPEQSLYVNLAQVEHCPQLLDGRGSPVNVVGHTVMYEKSLEELKAIFSHHKAVGVIGNGFSFTWLVAHFGSTFPITCLHQPNSQLPIPTGISSISYQNVSFLTLDKIEIRFLEEDLVEVRGEINGKMQSFLLPNMILAAAGYRKRHELTSHLPEHQVVTLPSYNQDKSTEDIDVKSVLSLPGSTLDRHLEMLGTSGEVPLLNLQYTSAMLKVLKRKLEEEMISLPDNYWVVLKNIVKQETNLSDSIDVIKALHLKAFDEAQKGKPFEIGIDIKRNAFEQFLTRHLANDIHKYRLKPNM